MNGKQTMQTLNTISFENKKIFLDGIEIKGVTKIEIKKHADDIADIKINKKSSIKGLDAD